MSNVNSKGLDIGLVSFAPISKATQVHRRVIEPAAIAVGDALDKKLPVEDPAKAKLQRLKGQGRTPKTKHSK